MRANFKKRALLLLLVFSLLLPLLSACASQETRVRIYYMNVAGNALKASPYSLRNGDQELQVRELFDSLKTPPDSAREVSVIPQDLNLENIQLEQGKLRMNFNAAYENVTGANEVLLRSAIVKTMLQIPGIYSVHFQVQGQDLLNAEGASVGDMNSDTFMDFVGDSNDTMVRRTFTLYYSSKDGQNLVKENREIYYNSNLSPEKLVIEYLMVSPRTDGAISPIPDNTKILSVNVTRGVCYLNLDENFLNSTEKISKQVVIYSIVDSLCDLPNVDSVQIAINGENNSVFRGAKLSSSYTADFSLVTSSAQ